MENLLVERMLLTLGLNNGEGVINQNYNEIFNLHKMLNDAKIPHTFQPFRGIGWQIIYPSDDDKRVMDAVEHSFSYGAEKDLLEIMGLLTDEELTHDTVLGGLTAEEVFKRIKTHWENKE